MKTTKAIALEQGTSSNPDDLILAAAVSLAGRTVPLRPDSASLAALNIQRNALELALRIIENRRSERLAMLGHHITALPALLSDTAEAALPVGRQCFGPQLRSLSGRFSSDPLPVLSLPQATVIPSLKSRFLKLFCKVLIWYMVVFATDPIGGTYTLVFELPVAVSQALYQGFVHGWDSDCEDWYRCDKPSPE